MDFILLSKVHLNQSNKLHLPKAAFIGSLKMGLNQSY